MKVNQLVSVGGGEVTEVVPGTRLASCQLHSPFHQGGAQSFALCTDVVLLQSIDTESAIVTLRETSQGSDPI